MSVNRLHRATVVSTSRLHESVSRHVIDSPQQFGGMAGAYPIPAAFAHDTGAAGNIACPQNPETGQGRATLQPESRCNRVNVGALLGACRQFHFPKASIGGHCRTSCGSFQPPWDSFRTADNVQINARNPPEWRVFCFRASDGVQLNPGRRGRSRPWRHLMAACTGKFVALAVRNAPVERRLEGEDRGLTSMKMAMKKARFPPRLFL